MFTMPSFPSAIPKNTRARWPFGVPRLRGADRLKAELQTRCRLSPGAAFTLTELLVVIAILALLAVTQLPALTRAKVPVHHTQCMNNLRQIGQAAMLYMSDNNDAYPYGDRISMANVTNWSWPMELLHYMGGYQPGIQPAIYLCPSVTDIPNTNYAFQLHYQRNRQLLRDTSDSELDGSVAKPIRGSQVRKAAIYWMFMEKNPTYEPSIRPGGLGTVLAAWNVPPGSPEFRRHNGGMNTAAADGHVELLRTPPYQPGAPPPQNFLELGDCASGVNPASSWSTSTPHNGTRVKLFCRYSQGASGIPPF